MTDSNITISQNEVVTNLVKSSIAKAQKSYQAYIEMSEKMHAGSQAPAGDSFNQKALKIAKDDANANFAHALSLLDVTSEDEALRMQDEHAGAQSAIMAERVAELQSMAKDEANEDEAKETVSITEPVEEVSSVERPTKQLGVAAAALAAVASAGLTGAALASDDEPIVSKSDVGLETSEVGSAQIAAEIEENAIAASEDILDEVASADPVITETIAPVSEPSIEEEIETLAVKIHEAKDMEAIEAEAVEQNNEAVTELAQSALEIPQDDDVVEIVAEAPEIAVEEPVVSEAAEIALEPPVGAEVEEVAVEEPVVAEVPEVVLEAPAVAEVEEVVLEAPAVAEVPEVVLEAPVVAEVEEVAFEAPAVAEVEEVFLEAPAVAEVPEVVLEAPAVAEVAVVATEVRVIPEVSLEPSIPVQTPEPVAEVPAVVEQETTSEAESFDSDLSARLDAVRAMLQGSV